jgi:hypothetical protein
MVYTLSNKIEDKFALQYGPTQGSQSKIINDTIVAKYIKSRILFNRSVQFALDPAKMVVEKGFVKNLKNDKKLYHRKFQKFKIMNTR